MKAGDVILIRFPFTDLSQSKKRPAVVISPPEYRKRYGDIILLPITSKQQPSEENLCLQDWEAAGLLKPSWVKPLVASVSSAFALQTIGRISRNDNERIQHALSIMVDESVLPLGAAS